MKSLGTIFLACIFSAVIAFGVVRSVENPAVRHVETPSVLDRILASQTLRCGYVPYNPLIVKDPTTGEISGIGADIHKYIADVLGVKLVWTAETSWANYIEDLKAGRYDMLCDMDFWFPAYSSQVSTNIPVLYSSVSAWVRPENAARFLNKPVQQFNVPEVTVAAIDGTIPMVIAQKDFPRAKILGLPSTSDYTFNIVNVIDKKADVTFVENVFAENFLKAHPGALVNVTPQMPLRVYAYSIPTLMGDTKMHTMMESIIGYMLDNGEIDRILRKNGVENGYLVAWRPYRSVK